MSNRILQPDTKADLEIRSLLDLRKSFVVVAGAGSGKTTSLVKALAHIEGKQGPELRRKGQRIACITYTEVATGEVLSDLGQRPLFQVSTIHSFLWTAVRSFQSDVKQWVGRRIEERLAELEAERGAWSSRTRETTKEKNALAKARWNEQQRLVQSVKRFVYGTGSDYGNGILGHDDVLKLATTLILEKPLLRRVLAGKYPYIAVDESQDTFKEVVAALVMVSKEPQIGNSLCFFGDPMQQIYLTGLGDIPCESGWSKVTKPENWRCSTSVLRVINAIRKPVDGLVQVSGASAPHAGLAKLFVLPAGESRDLYLERVRAHMQSLSGDQMWLKAGDGHPKTLVLVHRMAAARLGFAELYSAFNDKATESFRSGFADHSHWALQPFMTALLPMACAYDDTSKSSELMSLLRRNCPLFEEETLRQKNVSVLSEVREILNQLSVMLRTGSKATVLDVLQFAHAKRLINLDDRLVRWVDPKGASGGLGGTKDEQDEAVSASIAAYFDCLAVQFWGYVKYIDERSPYATQHGVKGDEFDRVLVILDDEEGKRYTQYSYEKYFGLKPLSAEDEQKIAAGEDTTLQRTRRLFYVCCSRARRDLAVAWFVADVQEAITKARNMGIFEDVVGPDQLPVV